MYEVHMRSCVKVLDTYDWLIHANEQVGVANVAY